MKNFIYKKLIVYLILLQPIIDMITSYMVMNNIDLSIGIIVKVFTMFLAFIYLVFLDKEHQRSNYIYLAIIMIFCSLNMFNNIFVIKIRLFSYLSYLIKYVYYLIMLLFFIRWSKNYGIKLHSLRIPLFIVVITYFIALGTKTAYLSHTTDNPLYGYAGWFSSSNELGNLLCLLFPVSLYNAFHNKEGIFIDKILFILCGSCMLLLGTKVGLFGFFGILIGYIMIRTVFIKKERLNISFLIILLFLGLANVMAYYKVLPGVKYMEASYKSKGDINKVLLTGRDNYNKKVQKKRNDISNYDRFIGKSFINGETSDILIVEQDFKDIYYMYGTCGLIIIMFLYVKLYLEFIKKIFIYLRKPKLMNIKYLILILAITLELGAAYISGHSLLSPSVSTYLALLTAISLMVENRDNDKKTILVSGHSKFINKIDLNKYDANYLIIDKDMKMEGAIYPYYSNYRFMYKKGLKSLFFNRFMLRNLKRNQKYDYILGDNSLSKHEQYYLQISRGKKVVVGKKTNKYFKDNISIKEINEL